MKKRSLWVISSLMTLALLGVFVMQLYYIKESYKLKSELFDQNVNSALNAVVNKVQKKNVFSHINKKDFEIRAQKENDIRSKMDSIIAFKVRFKESENLRRERQEQERYDYLNFQDSAVRASFFAVEMISEEMYKKYSDPNIQKPEIGLELYETRDKYGNIIRNFRPKVPRQKLDLRLAYLADTIRYVAFSRANMIPQFVGFPSKDEDLMSKFKIEDAKAIRKYKMELSQLYADTVNLYRFESMKLVQDVASEMDNVNIPLEKRLPSKEFLDTLIKKELMNKNIPLEYNYKLTPVNDKDKVIYQNVLHSSSLTMSANTYEHPLFSNDLLRDPGMLYVSFPDKNSLILENLFTTLASSAALLLILIFIFTYTILAIIKQKKLSEMKTDFINNMTHEFKTPVATIMIASEALKDPEVVSDSSRINRLAGIIYDENARLGNHIERVLNVARLEKKELKLELAPVDMNDLISAVVDSMGLQLQKKGANVELNLLAEPAVIMGDELHLSNVIYNLIDNANKYSRENPQIKISTRSNHKNLYLTFADEGIGMTKDQTKRIFDQFYRVPTGNLHDVKGFGLGLNYVQDIVTKMQGSIKVHSEREKGTTFEIILPFKQSK